MAHGVKKYVTKTGLTAFILLDSRVVDVGVVNPLSFDDVHEINGLINGMSRSVKKSRASAENGKKGGRPRKNI